MRKEDEAREESTKEARTMRMRELKLERRETCA